MMFVFIGTSIFAQKSININAEKVEGGVKISTTENGKTTTKVFSTKEAKKYFEKFGDQIDFNIADMGDSNYKFTYTLKDGETETIDINIGEIFENIEINLDDLQGDFKDLIDEISTSIEYEETVDSDGNKVYKIKTIKKED